MLTRRQIVQASLGGVALAGFSGGVPPLLWGKTAKLAQSAGENILVVVQLSGGNDGLNTVIPYADDEYYRNRFTLAIDDSQIVKIDDHIGFHPELRGFAEILDLGNLSIVQGVGYPNPNRSHFESMDLWHTAHRKNAESQKGWLGRCVDDHWGEDLSAIHYGGERLPLALATRNKPVPSIQNLDQFRLRVPNHPALVNEISQHLKQRKKYERPLLDFIQQNAALAMTTSEQLDSMIEAQGSGSGYPSTPLGKKLSAVAQLIAAGLPTRVYYVTHDGFDTHANQANAHAVLLQQLGDAMAAFQKDLGAQGNKERTLVMTFSEFGRRVRENASRGTDHGSAAPLFLVGGRLKPGAFNSHPSLLDLDEGDLKFTVDYRQVYATVLEDWLGVPSSSVLGDSYAKLELFV